MKNLSTLGVLLKYTLAVKYVKQTYFHPKIVISCEKDLKSCEPDIILVLITQHQDF